MTVEKWNTLLDALRGLEPAAFAGVILTPRHRHPGLHGQPC